MHLEGLKRDAAEEFAELHEGHYIFLFLAQMVCGSCKVFLLGLLIPEIYGLICSFQLWSCLVSLCVQLVFFALFIL